MIGFHSLATCGRVCIVSLSILTTVQLSNAQTGSGYEPPRFADGKVHFEESSEEFGNFLVVREIKDYRAAPILHGPWLTKEAKLIWRDSEGQIELSIVDNGYSIKLDISASSQKDNATCLLQGGLVNPNFKPSTAANWESYRPYVREQLKRCESLSEEDFVKIDAEMVNSMENYADAANAWKKTSRELFGYSERRCVRIKIDYDVQPFARSTCTRYSESSQ